MNKELDINYVRKQFPVFDSKNDNIFLENAGGSYVPISQFMSNFGPKYDPKSTPKSMQKSMPKKSTFLNPL